jgi:hypothetical protein
VPEEGNDEEDGAEDSDDKRGTVAVLWSTSILWDYLSCESRRTMVIGASLGPFGFGKSDRRWSSAVFRGAPLDVPLTGIDITLGRLLLSHGYR